MFDVIACSNEQKVNFGDVGIVEGGSFDYAGVRNLISDVRCLTGVNDGVYSDCSTDTPVKNDDLLFNTLSSSEAVIQYPTSLTADQQLNDVCLCFEQ